MPRRLWRLAPAPRPHRMHQWSTALVWGLLALAVLGLAVVVSFDHLLRQAGRPDLSPLGSDDYGFVLTAVSGSRPGSPPAGQVPVTPPGRLAAAGTGIVGADSRSE